FRGRLRRSRDGAGALDLEAEVLDAPPLIRARDQGDAHESVGQIDRAVGPTVLLLQAEDLLVVIGQPFAIADIECDVSDPRFRHGHLDGVSAVQPLLGASRYAAATKPGS